MRRESYAGFFGEWGGRLFLEKLVTHKHDKQDY